MYLHHTGKCTSTHLCSHMVWGRGENKAGSQDYAATKHRLANPRKLSESMEEKRGEPRLLSIGWLQGRNLQCVKRQMSNFFGLDSLAHDGHSFSVRVREWFWGPRIPDEAYRNKALP